MDILRKLLGIRQVRIALAGMAAAATVAVWLAWWMGLDLSHFAGMWQATEDFLEDNPWALFAALVILPALPVPTSALLFAAGVVWRDRPVMACALCVLAMALNMSWTYWLASGPARRMVEKLLAATSLKIPDLPRNDHVRLILVMKLTPGIPFFIQNYLLGFLRAPFVLFLPISLVCNGIIGTGVVLSGVGLAEGKLVPALTGISLIVVGGVLTQRVRGWLARRKRALADG